MQWPKDKRINNGLENTTQTTDTNDSTPLNIWVNSDAPEERQHE